MLLRDPSDDERYEDNTWVSWVLVAAETIFLCVVIYVLFNLSSTP